MVDPHPSLCTQGPNPQSEQRYPPAGNHRTFVFTDVFLVLTFLTLGEMCKQASDLLMKPRQEDEEL